MWTDGNPIQQVFLCAIVGKREAEFSFDSVTKIKVFLKDTATFIE